MIKRPNFILFITDQHRADHLGSYGDRVVQTPTIDHLAARGWTADRAYVAAPICMPNRASLMCSRMPQLHGVRHNGIPLPLESTTFVDLLLRAGWQTALVGKAHLQNMSGLAALWPPREARLADEARRPGQGRYDQEWGPSWRDIPDFDVDLPFYGFGHVSLVTDHADTAGGHYRRWLERECPKVAAVTGSSHALQAPEYTLVQSKQAWRTRVPEECSTTSWIADETRALLGRYAKANEPFFIQCSFPDPHHPFTPPGRFWDLYRPEEVSLPASFRQSAPPPSHVAWLRAQRDAGKAVKHTPAVFACTEREAREAIALNYGSITHIDGAIGRVIHALDELGLAGDTVCIFTTDHGEFLGDHQLLLKGPIHYQSLIRTPLIWCDPLGPRGIRSESLCSTIDLAPSILARAGVPGFNGMQGRSLLPLMSGEASSWRESVLIEEEGQRVMFGFDSRVCMRTLVTGRWRLSRYYGTSLGEIYDLHEDPHESRNLWDEPAHRDLKRDLLLELCDRMIGASDPSPYPSALA